MFPKPPNSTPKARSPSQSPSLSAELPQAIKAREIRTLVNAFMFAVLLSVFARTTVDGGVVWLDGTRKKRRVKHVRSCRTDWALDVALSTVSMVAGRRDTYMFEMFQPAEGTVVAIWLVGLEMAANLNLWVWREILNVGTLYGIRVDDWLMGDGGCDRDCG